MPTRRRLFRYANEVRGGVIRGERGERSSAQPVGRVYFEDKIDDMENYSCILLQKTSSFHRSSEGKLLEKCNGELRIVLCYKLKC